MSNVGPDQQVDLTPRGMDLRSLDKSRGSPFIMNTVPRNGEFLVRSGFGLVREYGTTLNDYRTDLSQQYGIGPCIGATTLRTPWETDQILAIHPVYAFTGNYSQFTEFNNVGGKEVLQYALTPTARVLSGIVAFVHDLNSGRHVEFMCYQQDTPDGRLDEWFPHYSTRRARDNTKWLAPQSEPKWAVFTPVGKGNARYTVIAIDGMGLWTYRPIDPAFQVDRKVDSLPRVLLTSASGEQSAFSPLSLADGALRPEDGFTYLRDVELGSVDAICTYNGDRVVYAVGNTIWFSDPFAANNVLADSAYVLPTPDTITMVAPMRNLLVVATARQTWLYQPSVGDLTLSAGTLTLLSERVGCVNNRAWESTDAGIFFGNNTGVYVYSGGVELRAVSDPIDRLWTDPQSLQMPLTDYYVKAGQSALADVQLPARIDVREQFKSARLEWHQDWQTLFCVCDDVTLCWNEDFGWHVWYMATHAKNAQAVQGSSNVLKPVILSTTSGLYMIGGPDIMQYGDAEDVVRGVDKSCYLLKLGRGGATERSADADLEDQREPLGGWYGLNIDQGLVTTTASFLIGKYEVAPAGFVTPLGTTLNEPTYWFLISCAAIGGTPIKWELNFTFDDANWQPVVDGGNNLDFILPAERLGSPLGSYSAVYNPGFNSIELEYSNAGAPLNCDGQGPDPLMWIGFRFVGTGTATWLDPEVYASGIYLREGVVPPANVFVWKKGVYLDQMAALEDLEQPVDWVVKTREAYMKGLQLRVRGVFLEAMHLGSAPNTDVLVPDWRYGPLNTATSTDMRDYSGQALDFRAIPGNSEQTDIDPTARLQPSAGGDVRLKTAGNIARWSTTAQAAAVPVLIDDAAVDSLATTDGSQGERASIMVHGTMNAPNEGVRLGKVEAVIRQVGLRRRWH